MNIQIKDDASPYLRECRERLKRPKVLMEVAGKALTVRLKSHFRDRQAQGNKRGWPDRYFWYGAKGSVANATGVSSVDDHQATVTVADVRFVHKVLGGTITPKRSKMLSIPLSAQAYALGGKGTIRELLPKAFVLETNKGVYLVTNEEERRGRRVKGLGYKVRGVRLKFWFKLVRSVKQAAEPDALPPMEDLQRSVQQAMEQAMPLLLKGGK